MTNILVSGCLLGLKCRYDGKDCFNEKILLLKDKFNLIPICPEQMGGLSTPRIPSEIVNGRLVMKDGTDVTQSCIDYLAAAFSCRNIQRKKE